MRRLAGNILFLLLTISSQVSTFRLQPRSNKAVDAGGSNAIHRWPNGENCTGRGNGSTSGNGRGSNPSASSSSTSVNTTTSEITALPDCYIPPNCVVTETPVSSSPSLSTPTPDPGYTNIVITQSSTQMTWSSGWDVQISSCDSTQQSKTTTKPNEWFTLITPSNSSPYIYIDLAVSNASFTVYINGMQPDAGLGDLSNNCTYHALGPLLTGSFTNNITIYVNGPSSGSSDRN
ncbi:hypothetical protein F5887DRAFT_1158947 [Amanita rubescens]|nr:hypothetical protein F5887DRAFT_1158947 [Amanita rubescens]